MTALTRDQLERAVSGRDRGAVRQVVHALTPILRSRVVMALVRMGGRSRGSLDSDADDFVQEVFVRLFANGGQKLLGWDPGRGSASAYFGVMATRVALDLLRVKKNNPYFEEPVDDAAAPAEDERPDPLQRTLDRASLWALGECLRARLNPRDRQIFELSLVRGWSDEEVREHLELSRDALYQARRRLRVKLNGCRESTGLERREGGR